MKTTAIFFLISLFFMACATDRLFPEGPIITENRQPGNFTGVQGSGSNPVYIAYGPAFKVAVKGSANLVPEFKTKVKNNILMLAFDDVRVTDDDIEVFVTMPAISEASLSGSGKIDISGSFPAQEIFRSNVSGSGIINVNDAFNCNALEVNISGSGNVNMEKIHSKKADVHLSGSGDLRLSVQDELKAKISGSGKVYYTGNPVVDAKISGSGKVIQF